MTIQQLCRERKDELKITAQEIADRANIPLSTVNNYFSNASKSPYIGTVGPICAVLGISLDLYFKINTPEVPELEACKTEIKHQAEIIERQDRQLKEQRSYARTARIAICVTAILAVIVAIYFFRFDLTNPDWGFTKVISDLTR